MEDFLMKDIFPVIEEGIKNGGRFRFYPKGASMLPLIRQGKDSVVFASADDVKKYDIVLYRRDEGKLVLHRIVEKDKNGYIMCGDGQFWFEKGIKEEQLLAKVVGIYREETYISVEDKKYKRYSKRHVFGIVIKRFSLRVKNKLRRRKD